MSARCRSRRSSRPGTTSSSSTTSRPGIVPRFRRGARSSSASYGDSATSTRLLLLRTVEAILHCAARSLVGESIEDPARYFRDNVAGGIALLEARARGRRRSRRLLVHRGGLRRPGRHPDPGGRRAPADQPVRRDEARVRGRPRLVRHGPTALRSVSLRYFNVAGATEAPRRGPRPRDAPHPGHPRARSRRVGR